jgi:hypothetical protein
LSSDFERFFLSASKDVVIFVSPYMTMYSFILQ